MKSWLTILLYFSSIVCFSQTKTITGVVQDSLGKPIPYAVILEQHSRFGVVGDGAGDFTLSIPDSLLKSNLVVSCLGYETQSVQIVNLKSGVINTIKLQSKQFVFAPVTVSSQRAKFCPETRGVLNKKSNGSFCLKAGDELALFIPTSAADSGIVKAVRYYIRKDGLPNSPFRVKLYRIDPVSNGPGELLLDHDTIVYASRGNQWLEIDLNAFNIPVPDNGFFVAMQWLPDAESYTKKLGEYEMNGNGQALGLIKDGSMVHWIRTFTFGWTSSTHFAPDFQPMIAAVLSKECK